MLNSTSGVPDAAARPDSSAARSQRGQPGFPPWPGPAGSIGGTGSAMAGEATEPLPAAGDPVRALPGQIARFGELAGRDLAARAVAAASARGACDPQRHGAARTYQPLTAGEQREMLALRAALTRDHPSAAPAGTAGTARPGPDSILRVARLRRPPSPGPARATARHRRAAGADPR
jgi:hypothetical protein